jgi:hypothetical protein
MFKQCASKRLLDSLTLIWAIFPLMTFDDPNEGKGGELVVWGLFKHCLVRKDLSACQFLAKSNGGVLFPWMTFGDPYGGQGVKLAAWVSLKHCSGPKDLSPCQFSAKSNRGVLFSWVTFGDPYGGQGVELAAWRSFKHCSGPKDLSPCQFSAKSNRRAFPHTLSAMSFFGYGTQDGVVKLCDFKKALYMTIWLTTENLFGLVCNWIYQYTNM